MRLPTVTRKKLAGALVPLVLAGGLAAPLAATANSKSDSGKPVAASQAQGATKGFDVRNYSSHPMKLGPISGNANMDGPKTGAVLQPGETHHFELEHQFLGKNQQLLNYYPLEENGTAYPWPVVAHMMTDGFNWPSAYCSVTAPNSGKQYACDPETKTWVANVTTLTLMDKPNTQITVPAGQGQAQAKLLKQFCDAGGAKCTFKPTKREHILGPPRQASDPVANPYDLDLKTTITATNAVRETTSLGASVTVGVDNIIQAAITGTYGKEWTKEWTFSQAIETNIPPGKVVWFTHTAPILKDTGDFTVTLGNTTWHLNDVTFETPDLTDQAKKGEYRPIMEDATKAEMATAKAHPQAGELVKP